MAIGAFAASLLVVPITLAVNAAKDSTELVAQLRSRHALSQKTAEPTASSHPTVTPNGHPPAAGTPQPDRNPRQPSFESDVKALAKAKSYRNYGLDLSKGRVHDSLKAGVLEPSMSKVKQLKSAVEACVAIMRIDTLIKLDPEQRGDGGDDGHGH